MKRPERKISPEQRRPGVGRPAAAIAEGDLRAAKVRLARLEIAAARRRRLAAQLRIEVEVAEALRAAEDGAASPAVPDRRAQDLRTVEIRTTGRPSVFFALSGTVH